MPCPFCAFEGDGPHACPSGIEANGLFSSLMRGAYGQHTAKPPPTPAEARFYGEPTLDQRKALEREAALLEGGGEIHPQTNCSHGTRGYALLYLEWEGLARKERCETGPLPTDVFLRFTLTSAGEKARDELLTVRVTK